MSTLTDRRVQILVGLVNEAIAVEPFERGGQQWAALSMEEWEERTGWSIRSLESYFRRPPFYCERASKIVAGKLNPVRVKIVRVLATGETPTKTDQRVANELRKIWLDREIDQDAIAAKTAAGKPMKTATILDGGRPTMSANDHGLLIGLAQDWPEGEQHAILKWVLANWTAFMSGVEAVKMANQDAETGDTEQPLKAKWYLKYPYLPTIRVYHKVALELYAIHKPTKTKSKKPMLMAAE